MVLSLPLQRYELRIVVNCGALVERRIQHTLIRQARLLRVKPHDARIGVIVLILIAVRHAAAHLGLLPIRVAIACTRLIEDIYGRPVFWVILIIDWRLMNSGPLKL